MRAASFVARWPCSAGVSEASAVAGSSTGGSGSYKTSTRLRRVLRDVPALGDHEQQPARPT